MGIRWDDESDSGWNPAPLPNWAPYLVGIIVGFCLGYLAFAPLS